MISFRRRSLVLLLGVGAASFLPAGLTSCGANPTTAPAPLPAAGVAAMAGRPFTQYTAEVVNRYPHDSTAFTQGLLFQDAETLLESTGMNGRSSVRRVDLKTGRVLAKTDLPARYFGEGLAWLGGRLYQLTWKDQKGFIYNGSTLEKTGEFAYAGEGWGLTTDGTSLIMSDGSNRLRFLDPRTFAVTRTIEATHQGKPVTHLNELEYIDGEIFANIWGTDLIARLDAQTGQSTGVINCSSVFPASQRASAEQVLNGIAWHPGTRRLLITGKWWPEVFEVTLKPVPQ